jgi:hypothetical protein
MQVRSGAKSGQIASVREEQGRARPLRPQPPPRRRAAPAGILRPDPSPGARAYYDTLPARGIGHHPALRQLANRLVGILDGCLKTGTRYNQETAWGHNLAQQQAAV